MAMVANLTQHCEVQLPDVPIGLDLLQSPIMLFICKFTDLPAGPPHCSSLILGCFGLYGEWPPNGSLVALGWMVVMGEVWVGQSVV